MSFKQKKVSGRKAGTPNRKTEEFFDKCAQHSHDPILFNILVAKNDWAALGYLSPTILVTNKNGQTFEEDRISIEARLSANNKLLDFMYPKRKALEFVDDKGEASNTIKLSYSVESLKDAAKPKP